MQLRFTGGQKLSLPGAKEVELAGGKIWAGKEDAAEIKKQCSLEEARPCVVFGMTLAFGRCCRCGMAMPGAFWQDGRPFCEVIPCGDLLLHILRTPGHTPGVAFTP